MNAMRVLVAGVVVCLLAGGALAEDKAEKGDNAKLIVGKWEVTKSEGLPKGSVVEFTKDGKLKVTVKRDEGDVDVEGTYKVEGDKFKITLKQGDNETMQTIAIKKLTKTDLHTENENGNSTELTRKK